MSDLLHYFLLEFLKSQTQKHIKILQEAEYIRYVLGCIENFKYIEIQL